MTRPRLFVAVGLALMLVGALMPASWDVPASLCWLGGATLLGFWLARARALRNGEVA